MRLKRVRPSGDEGSLLPLSIFYGGLSLVLILLVVAATSLYLERKRLFALADAAALAGSESFTLSEMELATDGPRVALRPQQVQAAVEQYLLETGQGRFEALQLESASTADGRTADVRISAYWCPPVLSLLLPEGIRLEVSAVARSVFG